MQAKLIAYVDNLSIDSLYTLFSGAENPSLREKPVPLQSHILGKVPFGVLFPCFPLACPFWIKNIRLTPNIYDPLRIGLAGGWLANRRLVAMK